jgi:hypothetical protein
MGTRVLSEMSFAKHDRPHRLGAIGVGRSGRQGVVAPGAGVQCGLGSGFTCSHSHSQRFPHEIAGDTF